MATSNTEIDPETVRVRKEDLVKLLTCSICNDIFNDPVNITECLHIFCKRCIRKKIAQENLKRCPVCSVDLGCMPLDKLRPDYSWSSIRAAIAPSIGQAVKVDDEPSEGEPEQSIPSPVRRKARLSSLADKRNVSRSCSFGRNRKANGRKVFASRGSDSSSENPHKSVDVRSEGSRLSKNYNKSAKNVKQFSKKQIPPQGKERTQRSDKRIELVSNLQKPLTEAMNITNYDKTVPEGELSSKFMILKSETKSSGKHLRSYDVDAAARPIRKNRSRTTRTDEPQGMKIYAQTIADTTSDQHTKRVAPVWLSLVSSVNQEGVEPLPQIPRRYLMIKDVTLPVSFIKKYVMQKLDLQSEDEVEVSLWGSPLHSDLKLHGLVDMWSQTVSNSEKISAKVGDSAQEFVMVLTYGRKYLHRRN